MKKIFLAGNSVHRREYFVFIVFSTLKIKTFFEFKINILIDINQSELRTGSQIKYYLEVAAGSINTHFNKLLDCL